MAVDETNLIWIDLEMTGLNPQQDQIIELATLVTDNQCQPLAEGPVYAIHQPESVLTQMDAWNRRQHTNSGLLQRVRLSQHSLASAEQGTLQFLQQWVPTGVSPMCGNSICQDRRFLARLMPSLERFFHYRHLDVSTLKVLAERWAPEVAASVNKTSAHLALSDIQDSIAELVHYRQHLLRV